MENIREYLYLEALLHDIGKFHQRADKKFIDKMEKTFNKVLGEQIPKPDLQALVSLAAWWSAGIDRRTPQDKHDEKKIPLYSIFNLINKGNYHSAFPLTTLDMKDVCFPKNIAHDSDGVSQEQYKRHWDNFEKEFDDLPVDSCNGFVESLLYLLKKYTWCIPSNTMGTANVSLFEHLKTTAAFADCLYLYKEENPEDFKYNHVSNKLQLNEGVCPVILLGGDLSGIQRFIYNIASHKAASSLKGRSFYLQLLIDSIIQRIISHPDINSNTGSIVYSSGGKFYMLLPNTGKVKNAIAELNNEFEKGLWEEHKGQLILNLDYLPFACQGETIGGLWKGLADKLATGKNQKFKSVLLDRFDSLFEPEAFRADVKVCAVTGIESNNCIILNDKRKSDEEPVYVLPIVKKQTVLGNELKDVDYLLTHKGIDASTYLMNRCKCNMPVLGVENYLFDQLEILDNEAEFMRTTSSDVVRIKRINETGFLGARLKGQGCSYGFLFYGGNKQALKDNGEMKTFEDLADNTYLGILRMDVDNLGNIFAKGLPEEQRSFAAYSTLSFLLDYFFSGYLNTIRNDVKYQDYINILYSGGDDVFAVGRWDKLIEFAHEIRIRFEKFVGRSDISISSGIVMVGEKFPIAKAAEMAGKAEDKAKNFNNKAKNALNLFGENISWKDEYDYVLAWKNKLKGKCDHGMPRSILHKIMTFAELKRKGEMKYVWHTVYFLKRFAEKKKDEIKLFCEELKKEILTNSRNYDLLAIAARWAELELKEYDKCNNKL